MKKIAFLTTQSTYGSTVVGRILPLAHNLAKESEIYLLIHKSDSTIPSSITAHEFGRDPFTRTEHGKKRLKGVSLIFRMKWNALQAAWKLRTIRPDYLVIVKSLPENVLAAWFAKLFFFLPSSCVIVLDVDDFELTANKLSSIFDRIAIHWANRAGVKISKYITVATPFLQDYFAHLASHKEVIFLPTGVDVIKADTPPEDPKTLLYAGSISQSSGHRTDILPEVLSLVRKKVPGTRLIMAGSGDDISSLKKKCEELGVADAVTWVGRYEPSVFGEFLSKTHVIIDPVDTSVTNRAKSSFRVATGVANGKPIVTSNVGIRAWLVPSVFHDRFFAKPADTRDYAEKIVQNLTHPLTESEATTMKTYAIQYNWKSLAATFAKRIL